MNKTALTKNLSVLLKRANLSEGELARRIGMTQPTLHRILKGESKDPRRSNLEKIAAYFKISVDQLCGEVIPAHGGSDDTALKLDNNYYDARGVIIRLLEEEAAGGNDIKSKLIEGMLEELLKLSPEDVKEVTAMVDGLIKVKQTK